MAAIAPFNIGLKYCFPPAVYLFWLIVHTSHNIDFASAQSQIIPSPNAVNIPPVAFFQKSSQFQNIRAARISVEIQLPDLETKIRQSESRIRDFNEQHPGQSHEF